jgi:hypothetical protein
MTETVTGEQPAIADQTPVETEVTADAAPAVTDADESQDPKRKPGAEARISELTRLRREAERDRDYWRDQATRQPQAKPDTAEPDAPKKSPTLEGFNYDEAAYQAALTAHVTEEAARKVREEFRKEQAQLTEKQRAESWAKRQSDFAAKTPDYEEKAFYAPISNEVAQIVMDLEKGPEVAYYLGAHPDEARAISAMNERQAAVAIGRIEAKLEVPAKPASAPKPVSKAPPPPPQIEAVEPAVSKDPSEMTDTEFSKWRKRQIAQRR